MPTATVTVRQLKNKESGLDISIPTYTEIPGLLGGTVEYNIVVVSNLSYFKSPKHKDTDVVQFMISKKYGEVEDFYKRLNDKFSGTTFPPLPKKAFLMNEGVIRERRTTLEHFFKFIAVVPKIVKAPLFLEFLGVKAGKLKSGEDQASKENEKDEDKTGDQAEVPEEEENKSGVFDEEEAESELFVDDDQEEDELFKETETKTSNTVQTAVFDEPDLGGGLDEGEGDDLFLPGAVINKDTKVVYVADDTENAELLNIEDNLDELLVIKPKKPPEEKDTKQEKELGEKEIPQQKQRPVPAPRKSKPQISEKPSVHSKPKIDSSKPAVPDKKSKPPLPSKPSAKGDNSKVIESEPSKNNTNTDLSNDDIMKYISENSSADADLDLF